MYLIKLLVVSEVLADDDPILIERFKKEKKRTWIKIISDIFKSLFQT